MGSPRPHTSRVSQQTQSLVASSVDQQSSIIHNVGSGPSGKTNNPPAKETSSLSDLIAMKNKMERISSTSSKAMVVLTEDQYLKRKSTIHSKTSGIRYTDSQMSQKGEKLASRISSEMPRHNIDFKQSNVVKIANKRADLSELQDSCYIHPTQSFAVTTQNRLPRMIKSPSPNRTDSMGDHSNTLSSASPSISPRRINNT